MSLFYRRLASAASLGLIVCMALLSAAALGENWPQWRGAKLASVSAEKNLPTQWDKTKNVAWRLPLPGPAGSTPVIWEKQIFLTSVDGDDLVLMCVGTDGKEQWRRTVGPGGADRYRSDEGNNAAPSPCTDGQQVWAFMANGLAACYDLDGKEIWKTDLAKRYGPFEIQFGMSSTPILDGDRLYFQFIHGNMRTPAGREAKVVCLEKATGKEVWRVDRESEATVENKHSYASPTLYRDGDNEYLITHGADYVVGHSLKDGHELWRCGGLNIGVYNQFLRFVASPAAAEGMIVVPSAKGGPVLCLKTDLTGNVTEDPAAFWWKLDRGTPDVPTPVIHEGLVYLCGENGDLTCVEGKSGKVLYRERTDRSRHRASPVYADGKIYLISRNEGIINVVQAGPEFKRLSTNRMDEGISSSLAIADGRIYVRTFDALYAIGK